MWQICDFGLAKWKEFTQSQTEFLGQGMRGGSITHTPPERWNNINQPRTVKCDVYGFAILLWELITEDVAFRNGIRCSCYMLVLIYTVSQRKTIHYNIVHNFAKC